MKKRIINIYIGMAALLMLPACQQFEKASDAPDVKALTAVISANLNLGTDPAPEQLSVKLINYNENYEINTTMDPSGTLSVGNIIPGIYTITMSSEETHGQYTYYYSGSAVNVSIVADNKPISVEISAAKSGALLLKEIFYCGSKTSTGGSYFRDQFYEIYNNSENVQDVKGMCIALLNPSTATANLPTYSIENADKYVYALQIWQIPTNKSYPVSPGESVIIAQMADNHQKSTLNPASPVNLLSAEFETLVNTTSIILDNPAINMTMAFWPSPTPQWLTTVFGGAFVIFIPNEAINPANYINPVGSTSTKVYKIPIADVIDAVELVGNANQVQLKRVPSVLDAGATTVGGTYLGVSVARKIKTTLNDGRVIYYDSNNSSNDFEVMNPPVIRRNGAKAPAWNTWK